jgi:DNA polymerase III delta prime subunit
MPLLRKKVHSLSEQFALGDQFLSAPDSDALKSAIIQAHDLNDDNPVVLKYWQKTGSAADNDLREIWRHEMRQAERVRAYPGADEVTVELARYGEASDAFFVTMPSDIAPLDVIARHARPDHWLKNLAWPRQRIVLWRNAERLARALRAVHNQGLVFGRLDRTSVFTASASVADFRLGGFEWCVRLSEIDKAPIVARAKVRSDQLVMSFVDDWRALGRMIAHLLGIEPDSLSEEEPRSTGVAPVPSLDAIELDVLRWLVEPYRHRDIDADVVIGRIDGVVAELSAAAMEDAGRYLLAVRLGETSDLTRVLRKISDDAFDADDIDSQLDYVKADISTGAELVRAADRSLILMTESLGYTLKPMLDDALEPTWRVATCNHARSRKDILLGRYDVAELPARRVEAIPQNRAKRRLQELRSDALEWTRAMDEPAGSDQTEIVRRGLLLAQLTEALFRAAEIIPVQVKKRKGPRNETILLISARIEPVRAKLAEALRVDNAERALARLFGDEEGDLDAKWVISESGSVGRPGRDNLAVRFLRTARNDAEWIYEFSAEGELPPAAELFLRKLDDAGTDGAMHRRLRMLGALATQEELATTLAAPRSRMRTYPDELIEDAAFADLDDSKQAALRSIWTTGPTQLVVGPPGVGKTRLVTEVVRRILQEQPSARILLSAQAHQALDQLAAGVQKALAKANLDGEVLLVRSKADNAAELSGAQTPERVRKYLDALSESPLVQGAPREFQDAIRSMKNAGQTGRNDRDVEWKRQRRSFESLVLQSANVLFSTANSGDLSRLVADHAQFDWVIIEEAAKATGPELLAPLLLSMRRLLIGDHNQLPPFDTDRILAFLSDQSKVADAVSESNSLVGGIFHEFGLDELLEIVDDGEELSRTCLAAKRAVRMFESLVVPELEWGAANANRRQVATELLKQHRMHPAIASVISECFYDKRLRNGQGVEERFAIETPPFEVLDAVLNSPIVIVDMPYVQRQAGAAEELPLYHNPAEVEAVIRVLSRLRPTTDKNGNRPSLAVLSPYGEQVDRLHLALENAVSDRLRQLSGFEGPSRKPGYEGTVDSFQGGEADVVVISLVRNNDHVGKHALGFLRRRRRMNVLLSRAKWKLIIVTSMEFLKVHSRQYSGHQADSDEDNQFLPKLISVLDRLQTEKLENGTPKACVVPWNTIGGRSL